MSAGDYEDPTSLGQLDEDAALIETRRRKSREPETDEGQQSRGVRGTRSHLTFIPEVERTILHRLRVVLAGRGARELAERLTNSEINANFRPTMTPTASRGQSRRFRSPARSPHCGNSKAMQPPSFNFGATLTDGSDSGNESGSDAMQQTPSYADSSGDGTRLHCMPDTTLDKITGSRDVADWAEEDNHLCIYCPLGGLGDTRLIRVRFQIVEGFTASLPNLDKEAIARDTGVVLLHWRDASPETLGALSVEATTREFMMRVAEANHHMVYLPLVFLLYVGPQTPDKGDSASMEELQARFKLKDGRPVKMICAEDASEEMLMASIGDLCQHIIAEHDRPFLRPYSEVECAPAQQRCCVIA